MLELLQLAAAVLLVGAATGLPALVACWLGLGRPGRAARVPRLRVSWTLPEVGMAFVATALAPSLIGMALNAAGFWPWRFGPETPARFEELPTDLKARALVWLTALAFPVTLPAILGLLRIASGTPPARLGVTARGLGPALLAAWPAWLGLTMVVFAVHLSVNALSAWATGRPPAEHPTMDFVRTRAGPTEVVLVLFQVMLAAPVTEELLFRGVVQPWLSARGWAPHALMGLLVAVFVMGAVLDPKTGHPRLPEADDLGPPVLALFLWPAVGLVGRLPEGWLRRVFGRGPLAEGPGGVWRPVPPADVARAVTATAAFFGLAHSAVWPTPVPLFVLGLGLGWLAQRTRHLAAPAAVHSAFNAVSCVLLFLEGKP